MNSRIACREDLPRLAATLVDAFIDDPVFRWMYPDDHARPGQLAGWFGTVAGFAFNHGHCYHLGDDAAAIWIPPDHDLVSPAERSLMVERLAGQVGMDRAMTIATGFGEAGGHHPETPPSWTLWYVGARGNRRGQGLGAAVIEPILQRLDADGYHSYLNSTNARNINFYRRLGWEVLAEVPVPEGGPTIRPMWRLPRDT